MYVLISERAVYIYASVRMLIVVTYEQCLYEISLAVRVIVIHYLFDDRLHAIYKLLEMNLVRVLEN